MFHKTKHRLLSALLAICMVVSLLPTGAWAEEGVPSNTAWYSDESDNKYMSVTVNNGTVVFKASDGSSPHYFEITPNTDYQLPTQVDSPSDFKKYCEYNPSNGTITVKYDATFDITSPVQVTLTCVKSTPTPTVSVTVDETPVATAPTIADLNSGYELVLPAHKDLAGLKITLDGTKEYTCDLTTGKFTTTDENDTYYVFMSYQDGKVVISGNVTNNVTTSIAIAVTTTDHLYSLDKTAMHGVTISNESGIKTENSKTYVTNGTNYSATLTLEKADKPLKTLSVKIGNAEAIEATFNANGTISFGESGITCVASGTNGYTLTIPGNLITGDVVIACETDTTVPVTFTSTTVTAASIGSGTTANVNEDYSVVLTPKTTGDTIKTITVTIGSGESAKTYNYTVNGDFVAASGTASAPIPSFNVENGTLTIPAALVTAPIAITATAAKMVTVTMPNEVTAKHGDTAVTGSEKVEATSDYTLTLTPDTGKAITEINVAVSDKTYTWKYENGKFKVGTTEESKITFSAQTGLLTMDKSLLTGDVTINVTVGAGIKIEQKLTRVTSSYTQKSIAPGNSFTATYTPTAGSSLPTSFTVQIGGTSYTVSSDGKVKNSAGTAVSNSGITYTYTKATESASEYGTLTISTRAASGSGSSAVAQTGDITITMEAIPSITRDLTNYQAQSNEAATGNQTLVPATTTTDAYYTTTTTLKPNTGYAIPEYVAVTVGETTYRVYAPVAPSTSCTIKTGADGTYTCPTSIAGTAGGTPIILATYSADTGVITIEVKQMATVAKPVKVTSSAQPILTLKLTSLELDSKVTDPNPSNTRVISHEKGTYAITNTSTSVELAVKSGFTAPSNITVSVGDNTYSVTLPTADKPSEITQGSAKVTVEKAGFNCLKTNTGYTLSFSAVTKPITIQDTAVLTITQNLTGVNSSNLSAQAILNSSWTTYLTAKPGYTLSSLDVTVNGYKFVYDTKTGSFARPSGFASTAAIPVTFDKDTGKLTVTSVTTPITLNATASADKSIRGQLDVAVTTQTGETISKVTYQTTSSNAAEMTKGEDGIYSVGNLSLGTTYTVTVYTNKSTLTAQVVMDSELIRLSLDTAKKGNTVASVLTDGALAVTVSGLDKESQFTHAFTGYDLNKDAITVKLELQIADVTSTVDESIASLIQSKAGTMKQVSTYISIANYKLVKFSGSDLFTSLGTDELYDLVAVEITLPNALLGKTGLTVYSYEGTTAAQVATAPSGFNDYYTISEDGKTLTLYTDTPSAIYALVCDAPTYTVTFEMGEGAQAVEPVKVLQDGGKPVTVSIAPPDGKEGYVFEGWYYDADFTKAVEGDSISITADTTLYAKWKAPIPVPTFSDVTSDKWFYAAVTACAEQGIVNGYSDETGSTFRPNNNITREEAAKIIAEAVGIGKEITPTVDLIDIDNSWAKYYIIACANHGIITGDPDGSFRPKDYITRAEMAVMISRAFKLTGTSAEKFPDDNGAGAWRWASDAIYACKTAEIITGYPDGTFRPENPITRAETAKMIATQLKLI